jgi:hypothetical protein
MQQKDEVVKQYQELYSELVKSNTGSGLYDGITSWEFWGQLVRGYLLDELNVVEGGLANKRVLIVCAGMGFEARPFIQAGAKVVCIDIVHPPIPQEIRDNVQYCVCDADAMCFKENSFDIIRVLKQSLNTE